jgi:hypothetical protein
LDLAAFGQWSRVTDERRDEPCETARHGPLLAWTTFYSLMPGLTSVLILVGFFALLIWLLSMFGLLGALLGLEKQTPRPSRETSRRQTIWLVVILVVLILVWLVTSGSSR